MVLFFYLRMRDKCGAHTSALLGQGKCVRCGSFLGSCIRFVHGLKIPLLLLLAGPQTASTLDVRLVNLSDIEPYSSLNRIPLHWLKVQLTSLM